MKAATFSPVPIPELIERIVLYEDGFVEVRMRGM